jgi:hypothetical protein
MSGTFVLAAPVVVNVTAAPAAAADVQPDNVVPLNEPLATTPPPKAVATSVAVAAAVAVNVCPATVID